MDALQCITTFLTVLTLVQCQQHETMPKVELEITEHVVLPGSVVQFVCRLTGFSDHGVIVNFEKEVLVGAPVKTIKEQVSQSKILTEVYRENPRFSVDSHLVGQELQYTLKIDGVRIEDSGYYSCGAFHSEHGQLFDRELFEVYRAPQAELNFNGTYTITEGEVLPLECISRGALPMPKMEMWITDSDRPYIDHREGSGDLGPSFKEEGYVSRIVDLIGKWRNLTNEKWRDVTDAFLVETHLKEHCAELPGSKTDCPLHFDYDVRVTRSMFRPDFRHDEKQVTCLATMSHMSRDSANDSLLLDVLYKPRILCQNALNGKSLAKVGSMTHNISCRVVSNPPLENSGQIQTWSWSDKSCSDPSVPLPKTSSEYQMQENLISGNKKSRTLTLLWNKPISREHYEKRYCLTVRNEIGTATQDFRLFENFEDLTAGGVDMKTSAWSIWLSTALLLITALLLNFYN